MNHSEHADPKNIYYLGHVHEQSQYHLPIQTRHHPQHIQPSSSPFVFVEQLE
jgi:hypothetical protein